MSSLSLAIYLGLLFAIMGFLGSFLANLVSEILPKDRRIQYIFIALSAIGFFYFLCELLKLAEILS